jgi:hypothetical protein
MKKTRIRDEQSFVLMMPDDNRAAAHTFILGEAAITAR